MAFSIRTYEDSDLSSLATLLDDNCTYDSVDVDLLNEKFYGDPYWNPKMALLCLEGNQIIGFMQGVMREIRGVRYGYIKLMAVDGEYRRQGIAKSLYLQLEKLFVDDRVDIVRIYDVPMNYYMPGIDPRYTEALCFAIRLGFERFGDTSNLAVDLQSDEWQTDAEEEQLKKQRIEIKRAEKEDKHKVVAFVKQDWKLWSHEVEMAFEDDPPSIHVAYLDSELKAFSAHNGNNKNTGWFGPMGTHSDLRGRGIGGILLKRCLRDMKNSGLHQSVIPWVGPIDFYAHHANARVDRVFWRFQKKLNDG